MFGLGKTAERQPALIIDIGSASVGMAILVAAEEGEGYQTIWTHREYALMQNIKDTEASLKLISTTLVNAFLECGANGQKALVNHKNGAKVEQVQVSISAPWAHTAAKTITYADEHPFTVTEEMITDLSESAEKEALAALEATNYQKAGLELITNETINVKANGYNLKSIKNQSARQLDLAHLVALTHSQLMKVVSESREKILPSVDINVHSFMYVFYDTLRSLHPDTSEICLVNITKEATEVGIVRDGILNYTTHLPYGAFTLAREISELCDIPKEEAYTVLKNDSQILESTLSASKKEQLEKIISSYDLKIASLFKETGDTLSIPKTLFLHTDLKTEEFFKAHVATGAHEATKGDHTVHVITSKLVPNNTLDDTSVALASYFFQLRH